MLSDFLANNAVVIILVILGIILGVIGYLKRTVLAKPTFRVNKDIEGDYFFSLRYNFNNHGISNWYIERI